MMNNIYCPIFQACTKELHEVFKKAFAALSEVDALTGEVARLCLIEEESQVAAAEILGISRDCVVRRIRAARHFLQAWFGGDFKTAAANYLYQEL